MGLPSPPLDLTLTSDATKAEISTSLSMAAVGGLIFEFKQLLFAIVLKNKRLDCSWTAQGKLFSSAKVFKY